MTRRPAPRPTGSKLPKLPKPASAAKPKAEKIDPTPDARFGLSLAIANARKRLNNAPLFVATPIGRIPLRHHGLARLLGGERRPGLPTGCFIEINGREGAGKTTTTMALARAVITRPKGTHTVLCSDNKMREFPIPNKVAFLDFEQTFDLDYARSAIPEAVPLQVNRDTGEIVNLQDANLMLHQPQVMEEGIDLAIDLIESKEIGMVVIDSVPAMLPLEEREKAMSQSTVGLLARAMGKMFRKTASIVARHGVVVVFINQWRQKIGISFGDPRSAPGGEAAKYFDSIRLDLSGANKSAWFEHGKLCCIKQTKNKAHGKRGECLYHLGTGIGLSAEVELTESLMAIDVVKSPGRHAKVSITLDGKKAVFPNREAWFQSLTPARFAQLQQLAISRGAPFADTPVKAFGQDDD